MAEPFLDLGYGLITKASNVGYIKDNIFENPDTTWSYDIYVQTISHGLVVLKVPLTFNTEEDAFNDYQTNATTIMGILNA